MQYIKQNVVKPLGNVRFSESGNRIFKKVHLMGNPSILLRNAKSGELLEGPKDPEADYMQFISFRILAKVNVSGEPVEKGE